MQLLAIEIIDTIVKKVLSKFRYEHSLIVAETAQNLARRFNCNEEEAYAAGLLHDIAKELPQAEQVFLAQRHGCYLPYGTEFPMVLHGRIAMAYFNQFIPFEHEAIASATYKHTTAALEMSELDKIVYIADSLNRRRDNTSAEELIMLEKKSLTYLYTYVIMKRVDYCLKTGAKIYPETLEVYQKIACIKRRIYRIKQIYKGA